MVIIGASVHLALKWLGAHELHKPQLSPGGQGAPTGSISLQRSGLCFAHSMICSTQRRPPQRAQQGAADRGLHRGILERLPGTRGTTSQQLIVSQHGSTWPLRNTRQGTNLCLWHLLAVGLWVSPGSSLHLSFPSERQGLGISCDALG